MIDCSKCQFKVTSKMRFALTSNACPACGNKLLSHKDEKEITSILAKIRKQEFSAVISDSVQQDIAIFILFEFEKPSQHLVDAITMSSTHSSTEANQAAATISTSAISDNNEIDTAAIREQVRREALLKRSQSAYSVDEAIGNAIDESEVDDGDEDVDDSDGDLDPRAARLKKLAQTSPILQNNKHVRIRRID